VARRKKLRKNLRKSERLMRFYPMLRRDSSMIDMANRVLIVSLL
jgi:hypothetical protein